MDDIKYIISYIVEKCLQWLYATRKKRFGHRIIVGIILLVLLVLSLALILYILEAFLLYNCIGNNGADFARILSVVVSTVILIILLNWGTGQDNYSEVLLSYYYLISKRKRYQYNWIKIIVILFVIVFLISTLCQEIDIIAQALKFNLPETIIIGFVIISLFIYIPLTECVIDEVKFYRVKSIASIVQFLILLVIYITSMMDMSSDDVGNIYDIMIFAIGQIAFAESAISNYKSMYKKLKEEKKDEVEKYLEFHKVLEELFPLVHKELQKTEIDGNLLYYWKGKSSEKPILLMSHQDVVPAEGEWIHAPFSGDIADGKVWGRGTADTKCTVMAFLEAVEELLAEGFVPPTDVYLASSCTEEWAGDGAPKLVKELQRRGIRLFLLCDEGGAIITEPVGGIPGNFAMVGVFEKGKADVKFTAKSNGGHASAPSKGTPIARLCAFVNEVEKHSPFQKKMLPEVSAMFTSLAPYASFGLKLVLGNMWLFKPLLKAVLPKISAQAGAMLQTTIAFTMQSGSDAYNVIPQEATLGANMRFIPHQGEKESLEIIRNLASKYGLETEIIHSNDYTKPVDIHGEGYRLMEQVIAQTFPGLPSSPYVMTGATDAQFYSPVCDNCIRFAPVVYGPEQMKGMHGLNECMEYNCLPGAVQFYKNLICAEK